ncbi:GntR family transcriptional regulator [Mesobacillus maritimus]|uniref:Transcriptional regulator PhoB n=1 Tax=Mesobacillus maritimus TaxID=1643336 RepID=A0ABS7KAE6_9BACI|nr:GntR family transcriptional regulator [Mesobacillus maritimus]MBY0099227.1 transcriptional regulator PhoB [Mesobacillus maritimus]
MLNSESAIPLYIQLKQAILEDINNKVYRPGEKLPTEPELGEKYNVSRITVRKAVVDLVNEGYLIKQQGKGTFVNHAKIKRELVSVNGYSEYMISAGNKPQQKIVSLAIKEASLELAQTLQIPEGSQILELRRILYLDNQPLSHEISTYPLSLFPKLDQYIKENHSMHQILKDQYGIAPAFNNKVLNVVFANQEVADFLECNKSDPLYELEKIAYDKDKKTIYHSFLYYHISRVSFTISSEFTSQ